MPASQRTLNELTDALLAAVPPLDPMKQQLVVGLYRRLARGRPSHRPIWPKTSA